MLHPDTARAFEEIDAAFFSSDMLYNEEDSKKAREYVARWNRAIAAHDAMPPETEEPDTHDPCVPPEGT